MMITSINFGVYNIIKDVITRVGIHFQQQKTFYFRVSHKLSKLFFEVKHLEQPRLQTKPKVGSYILSSKSYYGTVLFTIGLKGIILLKGKTNLDIGLRNFSHLIYACKNDILLKRNTFNDTQ